MRRSTRSSGVELRGVESAQRCAVVLERGDLGADARGGEVVEQVVVVVDAVAGGDRRMAAREIVEVAVDEARKVGRRLRGRRTDAAGPETERTGKDEKEAGHC